MASCSSACSANRSSPTAGASSTHYRQARGRADFDLRMFVAAHFTPPPQAGAEYHSVPGQDVREHIDALWKVLERKPCLLYTSDAADERSSVDLGGRRIIKK